MRNLAKDYDIIFSDIDDTLIYGFWTDLMKVTWNTLKCNMISDLLMYLQDIFNIYTVNKKLVYMIKRSCLPVVFLTARKYSASTENVLRKILGESYLGGVISLQTDHPEIDKIQVMDDIAVQNGLRCCIFDDSDKVREGAAFMDIDAFDPRALFEGKVN